VQLKQGVDLKSTFEYEAAQFAQRRSIRGPQKVVKYCKNKKGSRKNTPKQEINTIKKNIIGGEKGTRMLKKTKQIELCEI